MKAVLTVAATAVPLLFGAVPANAAAARNCGSIGNTAPQEVRADSTSCRSARSLARAHDRDCSLRPRTCKVSGYTCTRRFFGNSGTRVRCSRGDAVVRFFYGT